MTTPPPSPPMTPLTEAQKRSIAFSDHELAGIAQAWSEEPLSSQLSEITCRFLATIALEKERAERAESELAALKAQAGKGMTLTEDDQLREYVKNHVVKTWNSWRLHQTEPSAMVDMLTDVFMHIMEDRLTSHQPGEKS